MPPLPPPPPPGASRATPQPLASWLLPLPRCAQDSPPAQLDRLSPPPRAAVQLRRAPQAAESAGSNATADPQRRRLPSP
uniref:homeobox protein Hox-B4-like n=1 Tax=Macaca mulatta TaxID=9544 RepID=UPI0010A293A2|nr:homeobox protein Hox-B4-like [Macaca mulatta]